MASPLVVGADVAISIQQLFEGIFGAYGLLGRLEIGVEAQDGEAFYLRERRRAGERSEEKEVKYTIMWSAGSV